MKLDALLDDLNKNNCFGKVIAHLHVVEFQKRGLPHAHILIILRPEDRLKSPDQYDNFISAEIPPLLPGQREEDAPVSVTDNRFGRGTREGNVSLMIGFSGDK